MEKRDKYFEELYERTKKMIYEHITARCFAISDIDDIFQNTFVETYKSLDRLDAPPPNEEAYVTLIANRQLNRYYSAVRRLRERIAMRDAGSGSDIPDDFSVEEDFDIRARAEEVRAFLESKPLVTQKVFFLYYRRGMTIAGIASVLGMTEASVRSRIYKTLEELKRKYGKEELV